MNFRILFGILAGLGLATPMAMIPGGCKSRWVTVDQEGKPVISEHQGRLFDLDPAISWACTRVEMAVVQLREIDPSERVYELTTMKDEPVTLTVRSDDFGGELLSTRTFSFEARVGRFGDHDRERRLIAMVERRMSQLARK